MQARIVAEDAQGHEGFGASGIALDIVFVFSGGTAYAVFEDEDSGAATIFAVTEMRDPTDGIPSEDPIAPHFSHAQAHCGPLRPTAANAQLTVSSAWRSRRGDRKKRRQKGDNADSAVTDSCASILECGSWGAQRDDRDRRAAALRCSSSALSRLRGGRSALAATRRTVQRRRYPVSSGSFH